MQLPQLVALDNGDLTKSMVQYYIMLPIFTTCETAYHMQFVNVRPWVCKSSYFEHTFSRALPGRDALSVVEDSVIWTEAAGDTLSDAGKVQLVVVTGPRTQCTTCGVDLTSSTFSCEMEGEKTTLYRSHILTNFLLEFKQNNTHFIRKSLAKHWVSDCSLFG